MRLRQHCYFIPGRCSARAVLLAVLLCLALQLQTATADEAPVGSSSSGSPGGNSSGGISANQRAATIKYCINHMAHRVVWTPATSGGRNCAAACRGFAGGTNKPYVAINVGSGYTPYFLCRAPDPSFSGALRAGCTASSRGKATSCNGYANGGPQPSASGLVLRSKKMHCGCVADRHRYSYSGCPAPVWLNIRALGHRSAAMTTCQSVCAASRRAAVEDVPGQGRYVCRPNPAHSDSSIRIGWSGYQNGYGKAASGIACHFASVDAAHEEDISVYSFDYQCLCI